MIRRRSFARNLIQVEIPVLLVLVFALAPFVWMLLTSIKPNADLSQFPVRQAGGRDILEYWIPADRLEEFNDHIVGNIVEVAKFELVDGDVVERRF